MSSNVAPAVENPVDILINSAPAFVTISHALISSSTSSYLPSFKNPMLMTMSISDEPFAIAFFVSNTLTTVVW